MDDRDSDDRTAVTSRRRAAHPSEVRSEPNTSVAEVTNRRVEASRESLTKRRRKGRRYRTRKLLGRGGMGEIHLARDRRVGRSVALKVMLEDAAMRPEAQWRFLREARVQGQLEHPAIVPVYDIGWDRSGRAYFAMKRVGGLTLTEIIRELRKRDHECEKKYSLRRLLSIFQQLCLAIDYAHVRGVIHRDIKPSNIMLGDFGEVYVLDWGIAKVLDSDDPKTFGVDTGDADSDSTSLGEVLGTVGYMAPEQMTDATGVDARADVYSLGSLLFQMLTLEPLHGRGSVRERAKSTQIGADARASARAPGRDVPPELDAICQKATALDPSERFASARAMHDEVERFLEGDRDMRLRTELAARHVAQAKEASRLALDAGPRAGEQRKLAIREAGRALALDPKSEGAARIVARLMLEPPKELPPEVREATRAAFHSEVQSGARLGSLALFGLAINAASLVWIGFRSWAGLAAIVVPLVLAAIYARTMYEVRTDQLGTRTMILTVLITVAIAGTTGLLGGLFLTPLFSLAFAVVATVLHGLGGRRYWMIGFACAAWLVPTILEWSGVLPPTYRFEHNTIAILPHTVDMPEAPVRLTLIATNLATIGLICALLWRFTVAVAANRERVHLNAWHLQQLAPDELDERDATPAGATSEPPEEVTRT